MTISALRIDGNTIHYAGLHESILVYRAATGKVESIPTQGMWIGIVNDMSAMLEDQVLRVEPGDVILLFTDGITERLLEDGKRLETAGLVTQLATAAARSSNPADIVKGIMGPLTSKAARDDLTLVAIRYVPPPVTRPQ